MDMDEIVSSLQIELGDDPPKNLVALKQILDEFNALKSKVDELTSELSEAKTAIVQLQKENAELRKGQTAIEGIVSGSLTTEPIEKTIKAVEKAVSDITKSDTVTFFAFDSENRPYTTDGINRDFNITNRNALDRCAETKAINIEGMEKMFVPVLTSNDKVIGVIECDRKDAGGFADVDMSQLTKDSKLMSIIEAAVDKEEKHQKQITDPVTGLRNNEGLEEYVKTTLLEYIGNAEKVTAISADVKCAMYTETGNKIGEDKTLDEYVGFLSDESIDRINKSVAQTLSNSGRVTVNDAVFSLGEGNFITMSPSSPEKTNNSIELTKMLLEGTPIKCETQIGQSVKVVLSVNFTVTPIKAELFNDAVNNFYKNINGETLDEPQFELDFGNIGLEDLPPLQPQYDYSPQEQTFAPQPQQAQPSQKIDERSIAGSNKKIDTSDDGKKKYVNKEYFKQIVNKGTFNMSTRVSQAISKEADKRGIPYSGIFDTAKHTAVMTFDMDKYAGFYREFIRPTIEQSNMSVSKAGVDFSEKLSRQQQQRTAQNPQQPQQNYSQNSQPRKPKL